MTGQANEGERVAIQTDTPMSERVTFRVTPEEQRLLIREAGGPLKLSGYIRGVLRGARLASQAPREERQNEAA